MVLVRSIHTEDKHSGTLRRVAGELAESFDIWTAVGLLVSDIPAVVLAVVLH